MNKVQLSLKENEAEILAALPKEFHESFKKAVETAEEPSALSGDDEIAAIKAELVANPDVDENAAAAELKNIKAPEKVQQLTEAEAAAHQAELLAEVKASIK